MPHRQRLGARLDLSAPASRCSRNRCPEWGPAAKQIQAKPSPTKLNQAKQLGFIWFYSFESRLFNGLQRIQIRIRFPCHTVAQPQQTCSPFSLSGAGRRRVLSGDLTRYSTEFCFFSKCMFFRFSCPLRRSRWRGARARRTARPKASAHGPTSSAPRAP